MGTEKNTRIYCFNPAEEQEGLQRDRTVYHYTSPEGLMAILNAPSVRFTDCQYLNDKSEYTHIHIPPEEAFEEVAQAIHIATHAIQELEAGETLCQFNCSILVTATTKEDLKNKILKLMSICKDRDILISKSLTQALDFLDNYINMKPQKYTHFANIQFPLSFQLNHGSKVGEDDDTNKNIFSPAIGVDID
jgi:hypothetical protein